MDGKGAAHALFSHRGVHDRVVGRMVDGVGETSQHQQGNQRRVNRENRNQSDCQRLQHHSGDENTARAVTVDKESYRRLSKSRGQAERGEGETELGEAYTVNFPQHREQRRQQ